MQRYYGVEERGRIYVKNFNGESEAYMVTWWELKRGSQYLLTRDNWSVREGEYNQC